MIKGCNLKKHCLCSVHRNTVDICVSVFTLCLSQTRLNAYRNSCGLVPFSSSLEASAHLERLRVSSMSKSTIASMQRPSSIRFVISLANFREKNLFFKFMCFIFTSFRHSFSRRRTLGTDNGCWSRFVATTNRDSCLKYYYMAVRRN